MKQKIEIGLRSRDNEKSRRKAIKTAVNQLGVDSAALRGNERNQIEVIGNGVDAAKLTIILRKKVGYAELYSVVFLPTTHLMETTHFMPLPTQTIGNFIPYPFYQPSYFQEYQGMNNPSMPTTGNSITYPIYQRLYYQEMNHLSTYPISNPIYQRPYYQEYEEMNNGPSCSIM